MFLITGLFPVFASQESVTNTSDGKITCIQFWLGRMYSYDGDETHYHLNVGKHLVIGWNRGLGFMGEIYPKTDPSGTVLNWNKNYFRTYGLWTDNFVFGFIVIKE